MTPEVAADVRALHREVCSRTERLLSGLVDEWTKDREASRFRG